MGEKLFRPMMNHHRLKQTREHVQKVTVSTCLMMMMMRHMLWVPLLFRILKEHNAGLTCLLYPIIMLINSSGHLFFCNKYTVFRTAMESFPQHLQKKHVSGASKNRVCVMCISKLWQSHGVHSKHAEFRKMLGKQLYGINTADNCCTATDFTESESTT